MEAERMKKSDLNRIYMAILLVCGAGLIPCARAQTDQPYWPYKDCQPMGEIGYIRKDIPAVPFTPYKGTAYEDWIPDTYDIAERANFCINVLTCATNKNQDHEQYFSVYVGNPLRMAHNFSDWCTPKYMESLPLLRFVTGSTFFDEVDRTWMEVILKSLGPDGLYYFPMQGKPWYGKELWWSMGIARPDGTLFTTKTPKEEVTDQSLDTYATSHAHSLIEKSGISQFSHPQPCGRILNTMIIYYMRDHNPVWKEAIEKMIDRLIELTVDKGDYCYFPSLLFEPNAKYDKEGPAAEMPSGSGGAEINARCIKGAAMYYKMTGYEPARQLAAKLSNFMRFHNGYFGPHGEFTSPNHNHFHTHTNSLLGMLEYADAVKDQELLEFLKKSYEWARTSDAGSNTTVGFMPETAEPDHPLAEGCCIGDMVALALNLSAYGVGDYYEDAERWIRNHFDETQWTPTRSIDFIRWGQTMEKRNLLYNETEDRVAERNIGAFAGWPSGNEWAARMDNGKYENLTMHCCTGNCTRAVYYAWKYIVDYQDGRLRVNMLLNRASQWADVYSYIPYEGQVDLKMKRTCENVLVHAPEWIPAGSDQITVEVDGKPAAFRWDSRYMDLGKIKKGKQVQIKFPISERVQKEKMGGVEYTLLIKGSTVISLDPPGKYCPLYKRDYYRNNYTPWRKVTRFVSDEPIAY
jgi:hypothetical protein